MTIRREMSLAYRRSSSRFRGTVLPWRRRSAERHQNSTYPYPPLPGNTDLWADFVVGVNGSGVQGKGQFPIGSLCLTVVPDGLQPLQSVHPVVGIHDQEAKIIGLSREGYPTE